MGQQGAKHQAAEGEGHGVHERQRHGPQERPRELAARVRPLRAGRRGVERRGGRHESERAQRRASRREVVQPGEGARQEAHEQHARDREPEHGQRDHQEGVVVDQLHRDHPVHEDLQAQRDERGEERERGRA